jgi:hypothetical protein
VAQAFATREAFQFNAAGFGFTILHVDVTHRGYLHDVNGENVGPFGLGALRILPTPNPFSGWARISNLATRPALRGGTSS